MRAYVLSFLVAAAATLTNAPAAIAQTDEYTECLDAADADPAKTREEAMRWAALGGGAPARHCAAIALIGLGAERLAAEELTEIGVAPGSLSAADRFGALMLAGDLWLRVGAPDTAAETFRRAADLEPSSPSPAIGLARAAAALDDWLSAITHLDAALTITPSNPEALTLRAAARRRLSQPQEALRDAFEATQLAPNAALAWFERGAAEMSLGALEAAETSWLRAAQLDPDGVAGDMARTNLQRLLLAE